MRVHSQPRSVLDLPRVLEQIGDGDEAALDLLIRHRWAHLVHYAQGFTGDSHDAEDAAQEALWRFWKGRATWRERGNVSLALLYRIVRNVAIDRRRARDPRSVRWVALQDDLEYRGIAPDESAQTDELRSAAQRVLQNLPARRREIFDLARFQGLSYQEIAEVLGISAQTVANQVGAAFRTFRDELSRYR
jgi:RNA polymerase sigma-70 factor, ECF subfamily